MGSFKCAICGYVYDPNEGEPESGIEAGIMFSDLPDTYVCPICGAGKDEFFCSD